MKVVFWNQLDEHADVETNDIFDIMFPGATSEVVATVDGCGPEYGDGPGYFVKAGDKLRLETELDFCDFEAPEDGYVAAIDDVAVFHETFPDLPEDWKVIGVEVPPTHDAFSKCSMIIDPQHGGGVRGFDVDAYVSDRQCAATVARSLVQAGFRPGKRTVYFSPSWDADALAAAAILHFRIKNPDDALMRELLAADAPELTPGSWYPGIRSFVRAGAIPAFAAVLKLKTLASRVEAMGEVLRGRVIAALVAADKEHYPRLNGRYVGSVWLARIESGDRVTDHYAMAPVVVAWHPDFQSPAGWKGCKYTVMCHPGAMTHIQGAMPKALADLCNEEPGWGGQPLIFGSPFARPSKLAQADVAAIVARHLE